MGYRSEVYLKTTTEGWITIKRFNDSIKTEDDRPLHYAKVNKNESGFYKISFEDIKWYKGYPEVDNFNRALDQLNEQEIPYSFVRIGEDTADIEHKLNWVDDIPDEISDFEPVRTVFDPDDGSYTPIELDEV